MFGEHWILLLAVLGLALVFLGPKRLPEAGKSLGQAIRGFRDETKSVRDELAPIKDDVVGLKQDVVDARQAVRASVSDSLAGSGEAANSR